MFVRALLLGLKVLLPRSEALKALAGTSEPHKHVHIVLLGLKSL